MCCTWSLRAWPLPTTDCFTCSAVYSDDRQAGEHRRADRRAARLAEREGGLRIDVDEHLLDRDLERAVRGDDLVQPFEDRLQALREIALAGLDAAARYVVKLAPGALDHAEAGDLQARIDPEDSQSTTGSVDHRGGVHVLHVVEALQRVEQLRMRAASLARELRSRWSASW